MFPIRKKCEHRFVDKSSDTWRCTACPLEFIQKPEEPLPEPSPENICSIAECGGRCGGKFVEKPEEPCPKPETPFDGEPTPGRSFTPEEIKERTKMFQELFDGESSGKPKCRRCGKEYKWDEERHIYKPCLCHGEPKYAYWYEYDALHKLVDAMLKKQEALEKEEKEFRRMLGEYLSRQCFTCECGKCGERWDKIYYRFLFA